MNRPLSIFCLVFVLGMLLVSANTKGPLFYLTEEEKEAYILGEVSKKQYKQNQIYIYISNITFLEPSQFMLGSNYQKLEASNYSEKETTNFKKNNQIVDYKKLASNNTKQIGCLCYLEEGSVEPSIGETIVLCGKAEDFYPASNPGMFDQKKYYEKKGIHFLIFQGEILFQNGQVNRLKESLFSTRKYILNILLDELGEKNAGILATMLLGDREYLEEDIKEGYQYSGIAHVLAISGLHISIIGFSMFSLCRIVRIPVPLASLLSSIFLVLYGIMVGASVSTMRAMIMFVILMGARVFKRPYDLLTALAVSGGVIGMLSRGNLDVGFYLSFGAVMGLTFISPFLFDLFIWKKEGLKDKFIKSLLSGLSILLATAPILMYFFFGIAPFSILANIIVIPLMSILIMAGILLIMTSMSFPFLTPIIGFICESILLIYEKIINVSEIIPGYFLITGKPDWWRIAIYYVGIFLLLFIHHFFLKRDVSKRISEIINLNMKDNRIFLTICYLFFLFFILTFSPQQNLQVEVLDVGQGDGIYIDTGSGYSLFIDGGSTSVKDFGKYRLAPYFRAKGVRKIDYLFITHYDMDHISGWIELLGEIQKNNGKAQTLELTNIVISKETINWEGGEELIDLARELGIQVYSMEQGDVMNFSGVTLRCIYPGKEMTDSINANSLTLLITKQNFSMLFTGDLEGEGEKIVVEVLETLSKKELIDTIEVLKVGHHGSKQASSLEFLETVDAKIGVISYGRNNSYGHPSYEVIERLEEMEMFHYGTGENGAILIESDGEKYWIESFN
jgi:competence protein ComEC